MIADPSDAPSTPGPLRVWPALDLLRGRVVQLRGGDPDRVLMARDDPADVVQGFADDGAEGLHVVDLDRALGRGDNLALLDAVVAAATDRALAVQVAGGLRSDAAVDAVLDAGAARAVVGTRAVQDPDWLGTLAGDRPDRIVLALDLRGDEVVSHGWTRGTGRSLDAAFEALVPPGLAGVLTTHVDREGRLAGVDPTPYRRLAGLCRQADTAAIAAGGVASLADLDRLADAGVDEVVIGSALYTGTLDLKEVLDHVRA